MHRQDRIQSSHHEHLCDLRRCVHREPPTGHAKPLRCHQNDSQRSTANEADPRQIQHQPFVAKQRRCESWFWNEGTELELKPPIKLQNCFRHAADHTEVGNETKERSDQRAASQPLQHPQRRSLRMRHRGDRHVERLLQRAVPGECGVQHLIGEAQPCRAGGECHIGLAARPTDTRRRASPCRAAAA